MGLKNRKKTQYDREIRAGKKNGLMKMTSETLNRGQWWMQVLLYPRELCLAVGNLDSNLYLEYMDPTEQG